MITKSDSNKSKQLLLIILSILICICFVSVIFSACGQGREGTYKLVNMTHSDGTPFELINTFEGTTLKVTGTDATIYFAKQARALPYISYSPDAIYTIPESCHFTIFWDTWTCFKETGDPLPFSCSNGKFTIEFDEIIWYFEK